jgi:hypothetical protein
MKHLLLAPFLLGFTSPVKAESVWLVLKYAGWSYHNGSGLEKIEMKDMAQCELMGSKWIASRKVHSKQGERFEDSNYVCLEGK